MPSSRQGRPGAGAGIALARIGLLVLLAGCDGTAGGEDAAGAGPFPDANLILVSLDTLRADHVGTYGHERPTTPHLDALGRDGVVFERFFHDGGGTLPSHLTMLTSLRPVTHGVTPGAGVRLADERTTLAEILREAGFATAAFTDGGWVRARFGFAQGFERYDDEGGHLERTLPEALAWIDAHRDRRFFLFLHSYDIHSEQDRRPYDCPEPFRGLYTDGPPAGFDGCRGQRCASRLLAWTNAGVRAGTHALADVFSAGELAWMEALYDGCINHADDRLGQLLRTLAVWGLYDRTLVVVTSDHGEEFAEHGQLIHDQGGYEEIARVPLVMKLPGSAYAGRRVEQLASMVDLMPTALALLGVPPAAEAQGRSLVPALARDVPVREDVHMYGVLRTERWKSFPGGTELYDLRSDPAERDDLARRDPERAQALEARARARVEADRRFAASLGRTAVPLAPGDELAGAEVERLRALGYLSDE